jgi:spore maturation protein CgeB
VDPTTYPTSNMRFFEIPAMYGLQLSTRCPEVEAEFVHGESAFYYDGPDDLPAAVRSILADAPLQGRVREAAHTKVMSGHLYTHRAARIVELLGG